MASYKLILSIGGKEQISYAKCISNMWDQTRAVRDKLTDEDLTKGAELVVENEDGTIFTERIFKRNKKGKIEMLNSDNKRVRRGFGTIILAKFDAKAEKVDPKKYEQIRIKLESLINDFDKLMDDAKKAKKTDKRKFKSLSKFSKEELENYLKSMK